MEPRIIKTYNTWRGMLQRCSNPNNVEYKNYGGRGIRVCEGWKSFQSFLMDMGERPEGLVIDRIDNDRDYTLDNCRWVNCSTSCQNRRFSNDSSNSLLITSLKRDEEIRELYSKGVYTHRSIARMFSISHMTVGRIVNGIRGHYKTEVH